MNSMQLALRVLRVDRRTRTSAILTAIGVAVATGLVLLLAALPFATQARADRAVWQDGSASGHSLGSNQPAKLLIATSSDYAVNQQIRRIDVALTGTTAASSVELPAGVPKLPGPGEVLVSSSLGRLIQATPSSQLADRFGGKLVGSLGEQALRYPEQLVAVVGHTPDTMPQNAQSGPGFATGPGRTDGLLELLAWVGVVVLLVPSLVLVASSARLTAARRERRLAALRLAGATPGQVVGMVGAETALSAVAGAVLGIAVSPALHGLATFVPWDGGTWLASDFTLPVGAIVAIAMVIPALVLLAAVLGLRRVLRTPLFAVGGHTRKPLHWWRLLALPVAGLFFLYAVTSSKDSGGIGAVMLGLFLLVGSAALVGPWVTSAVGGTFVRIWRRPASLLAGRRLRDDPKGAYRASAGVVLAVFAGSMALTLLPSFESLAGGGRSFQDSVLYFETPSANAPKAAEQANATLAKYGQPERATSVGSLSVSTTPYRPGEHPAAWGALVMTCDQAVKLTRFGLTAETCEAGPGIYTSSAFDPAQAQVIADYDKPGVPFAPGTRVHLTTPADADLAGSIIIDPSVLPAGVQAKLTSVAVPTSEANRETVRTAMVGAAGGEEVNSRERRLVSQQIMLGDLRRVTVIGLLAAAVLAGCSAAVATAGSVMDRRRTFGALIAAGTPVRVLSRALRMEAALPAMVATIGAGVVGIGVGIGLFSMAGDQPIVLSPWILAPVVLGIGVALLGASVCTPALKRVASEPLADE
ncbi:FtsX-like permease family protein [Amycolatopsis sp. H20-H5]|uniref:FtsX-like permease family protein n=1 Tax=Amycolatopsis sp. H20-H5 TaxID=3046309 RepID=UPI002DBE1F14|nr:FtsX-like permease family protein [Amycolatopsis sp. H20-H5]MEC3981544.1 FtsX-like permease family protein [Amycolatopsis sp. H20-H5]